jgi:hypothetical protein
MTAPHIRHDENVHTVTSFFMGPLDGLEVTDWPTDAYEATPDGTPVTDDELWLLGTDRFIYSHAWAMDAGPCSMVWVDLEDPELNEPLYVDDEDEL